MLDLEIDQMIKSKTGNGTVLVAKGNQILYERYFGYADIKNKVATSKHTQYLIASVTKQFTAVALLYALYLKFKKKIMAESDILINIKLSLENKISYYLNNIHEIWDNNTPSWTDAVTLHQLLIHAAGIPSYTCLPEFDHQRKYSPTELISLFKSYPLEFTPGTAFSYSNSGYALLGKIIEKITAMPLDCFLEKSLFVPLGMHATSLPVEGTVPDLKENHLKYKHLARGYAFDPGKINPKIKEVDQYTSMQIPGAAGGMISSTTDLGFVNK